MKGRCESVTTDNLPGKAMKLWQAVILVFAALWMLALLVFAIGTFGWFGQERDPLSAVYLVLLGLPWNRVADISGSAGPLLAIVAPGVNMLLLVALCRFVSRRI